MSPSNMAVDDTGTHPTSTSDVPNTEKDSGNQIHLLHQPSEITNSTTADSQSISSNSTSSSDDGSKDNPLSEYFTEQRIKKLNKIAEEENESLNLNLGLPVDLTAYTRRNIAPTGIIQKVLRPPILTLIRIFDWLLSWVEGPLFQFWGNIVPLWLRQRITFLGWAIYFPIHKALIGRRTGLHRDVSLEYHALTTVMWWGRLFPVTIKRMRFSLSQLHACHPGDGYPKWTDMQAALDNKPTNGQKYGVRGHVTEVYHKMKEKRTPSGVLNVTATKDSISEMTVTGLYIQHSNQPSQKVIMWIYGGAFLSGDSLGNLGIAEKMGMMCASGENENDCMRDVFIPDYRLIPEYHPDDAIHDIVLAYEYLVYERGVQPDDICLVGVSSGGGLIMFLLQALARARRESNNSSHVPLPAGGVLMGPFVDFTEPTGSMKEHIKHDLIVNQSVYDEGIPYLEKILGSHENRVNASPVYGDMGGLPPLCICVSRHEVVYDQSMLLAKRAKEKGVEVTVGAWKYMCHVFPMFCPFIPEGRESFDFMVEWVKKH